jgi:Zn-dependent protease
LIGGFTDIGFWIIAAIFLVPAAIIAIPVHELGHGFAAYWEGDPTPRNRGFLRPQIRPFIEPYGLVAIFLANVGWTLAIPVNEYRLTTIWKKLGYALGGPVANLVVAAVAAVGVRLLEGIGGIATPIPPQPLNLVTFTVYAIFFLNLSFAVFNLLPIPALDGWRILEALFRNRYPRFFFDVSMRRREIWVGIVLVIVLASFIPPRINLLSVVMAPLYNPLSALLLGRCVGYVSLHPCLL